MIARDSHASLHVVIQARKDRIVLSFSRVSPLSPVYFPNNTILTYTKAGLLVTVHITGLESSTAATMTTYIPALTIPHGVFANPAASILLPIGLGTVVGYSTRREQSTHATR